MATPGEIAVKVLRGGMHASEEQVGRFRREVRILAEIRDPHLIDIHAFGHDVQVGHFVVMPRLRGEDLASRLHGVGPLPLPEGSWLQRLGGRIRDRRLAQPRAGPRSTRPSGAGWITSISMRLNRVEPP